MCISCNSPYLFFFLLLLLFLFFFFFFFNDTATTEIYTLSLHDALPIYLVHAMIIRRSLLSTLTATLLAGSAAPASRVDRKSTRLNSSHQIISYAVFCLKKKKKTFNSTCVMLPLTHTCHLWHWARYDRTI